MLEQEHRPRREFLKETGAGAVAVTLAAAPQWAEAQQRAKPVQVGLIGCGGMGSYHLRTLAARKDATVAYVCDVDQQRLEKSAKLIESETGKSPKSVGDMREVLRDPAIDAVFIATPDHWHAPAAILALDAGKHVYVEKPCCHNIREGRLMIEAVKRSGKHLQVGTQSRSTACVANGLQHVLDGKIGEVLVAKAWNTQRRGSIGKSKASPPPAHLDFENWTGPAPKTPYRSNLLHAVWRWWYEFGCGDIGNDGVHDIDVALWGLNVDSHPSKATCLGGKYYFDDDQQFPDTQYAVFEYPHERNGKAKQLIFEQRIWTPYVQEGYENGAAFYGDQGVLIMGHTVGWRLYGPRNKLLAEQQGRADLAAHHTNFFNTLAGKEKKLNAPVEVGHRAAAIVHLANISARLGRSLNFDPEKEQITNDEEANALVGRSYREHWGAPKQS